ncbi:hypothetical protein [Streptomyces sp. NPDC057889]|uniref:hypothetical protein n=1 Tax=Streptomyces sp. NPDC057889 TaxID=3346272 RepID=UPI0036BBC1C5
MAAETELPRKLQYFPIDIGRYLHHAPLNTTAEVEAVAELLAPFGAETDAWDIDDSHDKNADAVGRRLRTWATPQAPGDTFLHWVGHGESDGQSALLAHALSPRPLAVDGMSPEAMLQYLAARQGHRHAHGSWAIIVIDACRSDRFVQLMSARAHADPVGGPRNLLLVSTSMQGSAALGQFRKALATTLTINFRAEDTVDLWALARELSRNLHGCPVIPHGIESDAALRRTVPALARALHAPLDLLAEIEAVLATFTDDERRHFIPKASGAELGEQSWYFEGRARERHQVLSWLDAARSGLLVVTGAAGSGKSALLGHVLIHTSLELCRLLERAGHLAPLPDGTPCPQEPFDAVLHLTGATPQDLVARIAAAADLGSAPADPSLTVQTDWLFERMRRRSVPFTMLVDALDEAQLPLVTAEHILRPLAALPHVRVIVGTRRSTKEGPDLPQTVDQNLLGALGADTQEATVVGIGRDPEAVVRYVRRRLTAAAHQTGLPGALRHIERFAQDIGSLDREFLYARLAVHEILQNQSLFSALDGIHDLLNSDHRQLFARAVDRLSRQTPANRPLLEALALAQGRGLPLRDGVWAHIATAIGNGVPVSDADIEDLTLAAAPYLMLDTEFGQSIYRLAHRTFAEHFTASSPHDRRHWLITARLAADANTQAVSAPLNPYLVRYLPAHASLGGPAAWKELARHVHVLDRVAPQAVTASVMLQGFGRFELPPAIAGVVASQHQLETAAPRDRTGIRQLASTRFTDQHLPDPSADTPIPGWTVRWARMRRQVLHLTLAGHAGSVNAVTGFTGPDGRACLASTGDDGTVRVWDPATGAQTAHLTGHTGPVNAVAAFTDPHGRALLASAGDDRTVRVWDPATGAQTAHLTGHTGPVNTVAAFTYRNGHTLLATGSSDRTVHVWDPATGRQTAHLTGPTGAVNSVAWLVSPDGRVLLAGVGNDELIRIWDIASGVQIFGLVAAPNAAAMDLTASVRAVTTFPGVDGHPLLAVASNDELLQVWDPVTWKQVIDQTGLTTSVNALAGFTNPAGSTLLAAVGTDQTVRIWDPATGTQTATLTGHTGPVNSVAWLASPDGRVLLATASTDQTVRIWDPATGAQTAAQTDHSGWVRGLATFVGPDGQPLLAAAGSDHTVGLWDPATGTQTASLTGHNRAVNAVAAFIGPHGRALLATAGSDDTLRLWDPDTGTETAALVGHAGPVNAVTGFTDPDGRSFLASAGEDGTVRIWDPVIGRLTATLTGHTGPVHVVAAFVDSHGHALLATAGSDRTVRIWDPATGRQTAHLTGHIRAVHAAAALVDSRDRTLLATAGSDRTVRIWDPATGRQCSLLTGQICSVKEASAVLDFI